MYRCQAISLLLLGLALALILPPTSYAKEKSASLSSKVAAGKWTALRLRNLPEGAKLAVQVTVNGEVAVLLLDEPAYRRFPNVKEVLFQAKTGDRISFAINVPAPGHYLVVIDNRRGNKTRKFSIAVKATAEKISGRNLTDVDAELAKLSDTLGKAFVFDTLTIRAAKCGKPNAFSGAKGVIICAEYAQELLDTLGEKKKAADALMFILLHEVGHVLLRQWNYPFYRNEEVADEFATVLMVMFSQKERARSQAEYFAALPMSKEFRQKLSKDDRHPLSVQRARNILRWVDDPALVRRWQPVLVPHMQTAFLQRLQQKPTSWTTPTLVKRELGARGQPLTTN